MELYSPFRNEAKGGTLSASCRGDSGSQRSGRCVKGAFGHNTEK